MSIVTTFYALATNDLTAYAYFDMGWVKTGSVPKKSGIATSINDAEALITKALASNKKHYSPSGSNGRDVNASMMLKAKYVIVKVTVEQIK